jgi:hypothetical protein
MPAAQLFFALILLVVCSFAPGYFLLRRQAWNPLEKLCGSIALSLTLLYLAAWALYLLPAGVQTAGYFAVSIACAILALLSRHDLARFLRIATVRRALAGFAFLFVWSCSLLAMIRVYCGARWGGDWLEHFQRCLFFLQRFPTGITIYRNYQLPARPPFMNVLGAFFLGQTIDRYEVFQLIFVFLNLLPFLACCLILPALAGPRRRGKWALLPLTAIFAMNPLAMQSAVYPWTKALTAFFVIAGLAFYLAALRKRDTGRMIAAFLALSAGLLVHYSAGPYVIIVTLHYLFTAFPKRAGNVKEAGAIAALCGLLLLTWFGWSLAVYGVQTTIASNSSITLGQKYEGSTLEKIGGNLLDSVLPQAVRNPDSIHQFDQPNRAGILRDNAFVIYQTNMIFAMGLLGGPLVLYFLFRLLRAGSGAGRERGFWLLLIPAAILLGIAVVGERDVDGVAHLTLVPLEMLGLTWLAAKFPTRRWLAMLILAGSLVDFGLGVFLHARIENLENEPGRTVYSGLAVVNGVFTLGPPTPDSLSSWSWANWFRKHQDARAKEWLAQVDSYHGAGVAFERSAARVREMFLVSIGEDQKFWLGWFARHGGSATLIGDAFGDGWLPCALLLAMWLALLFQWWRILPGAAVPAVPAPAVPAPTARRKR